MKIEYAEKWWVGRNVPVNPISESAARERHERKHPYVAIIHVSEGWLKIVDIADNWVSMICLDQRGRQYLRYNFKAKDDGRIFLRTAYFWEYDESGDLSSSTTIFSFKEDGQVVMEKRDYAKNQAEEQTTITSVDANWDKYPKFGDYSPILNTERIA